MSSKLKGLFWLAAVFPLVAIFAFGLPYFARFIPWSVEGGIARRLGPPAGVESCMLTGDAEAKRSFEKLVARIYPAQEGDLDLPIRIQAVRGKTVNAFAVLGGGIYVYDGLIQEADTPEELAGVLAHEIEHAKRRHVIQGVFVRLITVESLQFIFSSGSSMDPQLLSLLLNMRYGAAKEHEADEGGLQRLLAARVDVSGYQRFFERPRAGGRWSAVLSDHPSDEERALRVERFRKLQQGAALVPVLSAEEWSRLKRVCGGRGTPG